MFLPSIVFYSNDVFCPFLFLGECNFHNVSHSSSSPCKDIFWHSAGLLNLIFPVFISTGLCVIRSFRVIVVVGTKIWKPHVIMGRVHWLKLVVICLGIFLCTYRSLYILILFFLFSSLLVYCLSKILLTVYLLHRVNQHNYAVLFKQKNTFPYCFFWFQRNATSI